MRIVLLCAASWIALDLRRGLIRFQIALCYGLSVGALAVDAAPVARPALA
jgi:hypothetical protein